jgi:hypothetical protein
MKFLSGNFAACACEVEFAADDDAPHGPPFAIAGVLSVNLY